MTTYLFRCPHGPCSKRVEHDEPGDWLCGHCFTKLVRDYRAEAAGIDLSNLRAARS